MKRILIAFGISGLALASCNPDKDMVEAVVVDTGDITSTGCGYLLRLNDSALLKPIDLPSAYQHNGLEIKVKYSFTGTKTTCDYGPKVYELVTISRVKRNN